MRSTNYYTEKLRQVAGKLQGPDEKRERQFIEELIEEFEKRNIIDTVEEEE